MDNSWIKDRADSVSLDSYETLHNEGKRAVYGDQEILKSLHSWDAQDASEWTASRIGLRKLAQDGSLDKDKLERIREIEKTFDWGGPPTTDINAMVNGQALTTEDLDTVPYDLTLGDDSFKFLDNIPAMQVGSSRFHQYLLKNDIGGKEGDTVTNEIGFAVTAEPSYNRKFVAISYFAAGYEKLESLYAQPNFLGALVDLRRDALLRIKRDKALQVWDESIGTPYVTDGYLGQIKKLTNVEGAFPGEFIADCFNTAAGYSGLDIDGYSNPEDFEFFGRQVGEVMNRPENAGGGFVSDLYIPTDGYKDYNRMRQFTSYQILNNSAQSFVTGSLNTGFANRYGDPSGNLTRVNTDRWMQESRRLRPAQVLNLLSTAHLPVSPPVSVTSATSVSVSSKFVTPTWDGTYFYGVEFINQYGRPSAIVTVPAAVTVSPAGNVVTLTLTPPAGQPFGSFKVYRGRKNGPIGAAGINDMRLVAKVERASTPTTLFVDDNSKLPGSINIFAFDQTIAGWQGKQL
ncbi:MAG: hypothetical protein ACRC1W_12500, partial [Shewanella sp.]